MNKRKQDLAFLFLLLLGIVILFFNDRVWKYEYGNWVTGKISDFAGLLTFPIFIALLLPRSKQYISLLTGILFILWKSPMADPLINSWNTLQLFEVSRVIDTTDFLALLMLPLAHRIIVNYDLYRIRQFVTQSVYKVVWLPTLIIVGLIFCSTSKIEPAYPKGDVLIDESFQVKGKSEAQILASLATRGLEIGTDSIVYLKYGGTRNSKFYQIGSFIITDNYFSDTLINLNFRIYESNKGSALHILNYSVKSNWDLQNWKTLNRSRRMYKERIKKQLKIELNGV